MKTRFLSAGLVAAVALSAPFAVQAGDYYRGGSYYGNDPYDNCYQAQKSRGTTGAILGAVLGGLAGSGVASSKNREEGAVLGAIVGGVTGAAVGKNTSKCNTYVQPGVTYNGSGYSDRYADRGYEDRYADDYNDPRYRESAYDNGYDPYYDDRDEYYSAPPAPKNNCKVVYSTTRLPDGMTVREPSTYCRGHDGVWTRRN